LFQQQFAIAIIQNGKPYLQASLPSACHLELSAAPYVEKNTDLSAVGGLILFYI
jgi:hypothetical protein